ncbi:hypothetical protein CYMTET_25442 [Cymbomonas tetramitiformis]|uniref:Uncharacterized protein n=1 Tax=Cymbomonas tetramitiformis TaxID=36881 RepID=A0AAE0FU73_9CHLO|nr:hypothetical protein CYMTET_25442 [Cymbomonas tetramitiformis]
MCTLGMDDDFIEESVKKGENEDKNAKAQRIEKWENVVVGRHYAFEEPNKDKQIRSLLLDPAFRTGKLRLAVKKQIKSQWVEVTTPDLEYPRAITDEDNKLTGKQPEYSLGESLMLNILKLSNPSDLVQLRTHTVKSSAVFEAGFQLSEKKRKKKGKREAFLLTIPAKRRAAVRAAMPDTDEDTDGDEEEEGAKVEQVVEEEKPGLLKRVAEAAGNIAGVVVEANKRPMLGN